MFQLEDHPAEVINLNVRREKHGDEHQLAVDVKFEAQAGNEILDSLEKGLREALFRKPGKGEQQALPIDGNPLTAVKFPALAPVSLQHEFTGYEVEITGELEASEAVALVDAKIKKITAAPLEGGSVTLTFTASAEAEPDDLAVLAERLVLGSVRLTLTPPANQAEEEQQDAA